MKLIDMLVEDGLNGWKWPDGIEAITQDNGSNIYKGVTFGYAKKPYLKGNLWLANNGTGHADVRIKRYDTVADDWSTAIITRDKYEAALAAKNDGWIEWGGGEFPPVSTNTIVDVKFKKGYVQSGYPAGEYSWVHAWQGSNIIAYRLHHPKEVAQTEAEQEADLNERIGQAPSAEWNGKGLPPVGCVCEHSWAGDGDEWLLCKILFTSNQIVVVKLKESGVEEAYNIGDVTFRPVRSEEDEKRDKKASAIDGFISGFRGQETGSNKELAYALTDYLVLLEKL